MTPITFDHVGVIFGGVFCINFGINKNMLLTVLKSRVPVYRENYFEKVIFEFFLFKKYRIIKKFGFMFKILKIGIIVFVRIKIQ